jgi:hypothetical protein
MFYIINFLFIFPIIINFLNPEIYDSILVFNDDENGLKKYDSPALFRELGY